MRKIKLELILDDDVCRTLTLENLVGIINTSDFQIPLPAGYGKVRARPVFDDEMMSILIDGDPANDYGRNE